MSEFAKTVFLASHPSGLVEKVDFIYAPADTGRFHPVGQAEKAELRRDLFPSWLSKEAFVLGWVGLNQWRKQVWILYQVIHLLRTGRYLLCSNCRRVGLIDADNSIALLMSGAPRCFLSRASDSCPHCSSPGGHLAEPLKDVFLWLHMVRDSRYGAWPLDSLERLYDVKAGRDLHYTEGVGEKAHLRPDDMPGLYKLWDGLLYLSGGEGFGVPAWEAMSTGLPVVYSNYSSHAEFLGRANAGLAVGGILQPEPSSGILRLVPDVAQALEGVRKLYFERSLGNRLGKNGRIFVESHAIVNQTEEWHQLFQECIREKK